MRLASWLQLVSVFREGVAVGIGVGPCWFGFGWHTGDWSSRAVPTGCTLHEKRLGPLWIAGGTLA